LKEGRFSRLGVMPLQAALGAVSTGEVPEAMQQKLAERWDKYAEPLMQALTVRQGERTASLQRDLQNRVEKEIADITAILTELQTSILRELDEPQVEQLTLFSTPEREGSVLDMGMGCPESFVGLNPAIQIHMSSALPATRSRLPWQPPRTAKAGFNKSYRLNWFGQDPIPKHCLYDAPIKPYCN